MKEGASKYTGVYFDKANNNWQARISIEDKQSYIGSYKMRKKPILIMLVEYSNTKVKMH